MGSECTASTHCAMDATDSAGPAGNEFVMIHGCRRRSEILALTGDVMNERIIEPDRDHHQIRSLNTTCDKYVLVTALCSL